MEKNWKTIFSEYMKYSEKFIRGAIRAVYRSSDLRLQMSYEAEDFFVSSNRDEESILRLIRSAHYHLKRAECGALERGEIRTAYNILLVRSMLKKALDEKDAEALKLWLEHASEELAAKRASIMGSI